jgi:hypothetical protein
MPTRIGNIAPQSFNEVYGQIIGLYDDPTNDAAGTLYTEIITNGIVTINAIQADQEILWSRLLLCEIFTPYDNEILYSNLALVLRPRALWLFKTSDSIADYMGNHVDSISGIATGTITPPTPTYSFGDIIRIGTLPGLMTIAPLTGNWIERFYPRMNEEFASYGHTPIPIKTPDGLTINSITIWGSEYDIMYPDVINATDVIYYDKNVDGRTRFGGSGGASAAISPCPLA